MPEPHDDRVQRRFVTDAPNRLWCTDVAEHPTATGKLYCCVVVDVFSRVIVGSSVSDHRRAELVVDDLQMANWRRRPEAGAVVHSDPRQRLHLVGVRAPAARSRAARPDGPPRLLSGQHRDRVVLVVHAARPGRHPAMVEPTAARLVQTRRRHTSLDMLTHTSTKPSQNPVRLST